MTVSDDHGTFVRIDDPASLTPSQALAMLRVAPKLCTPWQPISGNPLGVERIGVDPSPRILAFAAVHADAADTRDRFDEWLREEGWVLE